MCICMLHSVPLFNELCYEITARLSQIISVVREADHARKPLTFYGPLGLLSRHHGLDRCFLYCLLALTLLAICFIIQSPHPLLIILMCGSVSNRRGSRWKGQRRRSGTLGGLWLYFIIHESRILRCRRCRLHLLQKDRLILLLLLLHHLQ